MQRHLHDLLHKLLQQLIAPICEMSLRCIPRCAASIAQSKLQSGERFCMPLRKECRCPGCDLCSSHQIGLSRLHVRCCVISEPSDQQSQHEAVLHTSLTADSCSVHTAANTQRMPLMQRTYRAMM